MHTAKRYKRLFALERFLKINKVTFSFLEVSCVRLAEGGLGYIVADRT